MPPASTPDLTIGIDLGGTNAQVGLVDARGQVTQRLHMPTSADDGWRSTIDRLADGVRKVCAAAGLKPERLASLGIGAPGTVDTDAGTVIEAPNLRWNDVPLAQTLREHLGPLPILVDNDVNAAIAGEAAYGAARGLRDVLGVWVGTGIGGGLILDGRLIRGPFGSAGEIGRTLLFPTAPLGMRLLEDTCARSALSRRLHQLVQTNHPSSLRDALLACDDPRAFPARELAGAYLSGDALARVVIDESADLLGRGIASACTLLGAPNVVLGGGLTESLGSVYLKRVAASCAEHVLPRLRGRMNVVATELGPSAGIVGAAYLARAEARPAAVR